MAFVKRVSILIGLAILSGTGPLALADEPSDTSLGTVVVTATAEEGWNCNEASPIRARWLGDQAAHQGAYQRAGECYLAAGDGARADRAFIKASSQAGAEISRKLASNMDEMKAQTRKMKQAFHRSGG